MDISKILEKALIVSPEDSVSKVAAAMLKERRHEAVVMKDGAFEGLIIVNDIAKRNVSDPESTKIESFVRKTEIEFPETTIEDAISSILVNNFKSLPVESLVGDQKKMSIVTKTGLIRLLRNEPLLRKLRAKEIMSFPYCVDSSDTVMTAKSIIRDMEVSAVPVVDKENNALGVIEAVDLLKVTVHSMEKAGRGEVAGEKKSVKDVLAGSVMQTDFPKALPDASLQKVVDSLVSGKVPVAVVTENGKLIGMITPRDVLKLFGKRTEGVYVTINGIKEEDGFIKSVIDEEITNKLRKINKMVPLQYFVINVKKYEENGKRAKYSLKSRLMTNRGPFFAHDFGWDLTKAARGMLRNLEREVVKKIGKTKDYARTP
jgi:CBS domain-containing protein